MKFTHLFFDLDGTLTPSAPGIFASVRYALEKFSITGQTDAQLMPFVGPPLVDSFSKFYGFSHEDSLEAVRLYREFYTDRGIFMNGVYDGIPEALEELKAAGLHLYVATGKPEHFMVRILEHYDLAKYFEFAGGTDLAGTRKSKSQTINFVIAHKNLEEERKAGKILMIGDREHDVIGAHESGIKCAGALWGYGSREEFEKCSCDFLIEKPKDIFSVI